MFKTVSHNAMNHKLSQSRNSFFFLAVQVDKRVYVASTDALNCRISACKSVQHPKQSRMNTKIEFGPNLPSFKTPYSVKNNRFLDRLVVECYIRSVI